MEEGLLGGCYICRIYNGEKLKSGATDSRSWGEGFDGDFWDGSHNPERRSFVYIFTVIPVITAALCRCYECFGDRVTSHVPENPNGLKSLHQEGRRLLSEGVLISMPDTPSDRPFFTKGSTRSGIRSIQWDVRQQYKRVILFY